MDQDIDKQIWDYIDGFCTEAEKADILQKLTDNPLWSEKFAELSNMHQMLRMEELEMPSMRFTKNVMEEIAQFKVAPATRNYINKNVIRGIGAFFLVMIVGLFIYFIGQIQWNNNPTGNLIPEYNLDADKLSFGKMFNNSYVSIFIGVSIILGLILVDKFLGSKRNQSHTR